MVEKSMDPKLAGLDPTLDAALMKKLIFTFKGEETWCPINDAEDGREVFDREFGSERYAYVGVAELSKSELAERALNGT